MDQTKKPNPHPRRLMLIAGLVILAIFGWNAFGAAQCALRVKGEIVFDGGRMTCVMDYSKL